MRPPSSAKQIADVLSVVCDAVHGLALREDLHGTIRLLEEAAGGLHAHANEFRPRGSVDGDAFGHALRAVKGLARALEAMASDRHDQSEVHVRIAAEALAHATDGLRASDGSSFSEGRPGEAVQLSVTEAQRVPNEDAIGDALRDLLNRTEPHAFVMFVDARTGRFIQFIGSRSNPLTIELPASCLTEDASVRAKEVFDAEGIETTRREEGFSAPLGRDVLRGTRVAMSIFKHVFESGDDFALKLEEN